MTQSQTQLLPTLARFASAAGRGGVRALYPFEIDAPFRLSTEKAQ